MIRCTANGIHHDGQGGLIYADGWTSINLTQNYLTDITSYSYGPIMASSSCGTTTILQNCIVRTYTMIKAYGQTFYSTSQTGKLEFEDNTAVQCPPTADTGYYLTCFQSPSEPNVKQNNFSFCRLGYEAIIYVSSSNELPISRNTIANDTTSIVYQMNACKLCSISYDNLVGIDHKQIDYALFWYPGSGSSITNSLFISVKQVSLQVGGNPIKITNCLFFDCSFSTKTSIVTASTLPFTNKNTHFGSYECITPILHSKDFTEQFEFNLKAFLTHFIIGEV